MILSKNIILGFGFLLSSVTCNTKLDEAIAAIGRGETAVSLNSNQIGADGARALADALKNSQLTELALGRNQIGADGANALAGALKDSQLNDLDLVWNQIGYDGAKALAEALKGSQLTGLNLCGNQLRDKGVKALAAALNGSQLTRLFLTDNQIGDEGAIALAATLKDSKLTELYLQGNQIGDAGARALAEALKDSQLTELYLSNNRIGYEGVKELAKGLRDSQLTGIGIANNRAGFDGLIALAETLKDSRLTEMYLGADQIGNDGAIVLAAALKDSELTKLYLGHGKIGDKGAKALAAALKDSQLTRLFLTDNQIGDEGAKVLAEAIRGSHLTELYLSNNRIGDAGAIAFYESLKYSQLINLDLHGNPFESIIPQLINERMFDLKARNCKYAVYYELVMKAAKEGNIPEIKRLMALPADQFRLVGNSRKVVEQVLRDHEDRLNDPKQKIMEKFKSLGISASENQVSDQIDHKLAAIDFSNFNEEALIDETVEEWKQMKIKDDLKQKITDQFKSLGISADDKQVSALIEAKLAAIDFSNFIEGNFINETVEEWKQMKIKDLKLKITKAFKTLGISADENQVSDLIEDKLAAIDFSNFNEEASINEIVEILKSHFTPKVTPPGDSSSATSIHPMLSIALTSLLIFLL